MTRGGLRKGNKSESNHLFKPKWNNKKTVAIRIPEAFKDTLLFIARYLDTLQNSSSVQEVIKKNIHNLSLYKKEVETSKNTIVKLQQKIDKLSRQVNIQTKQNKQNNNQNNYKIAVQCFDEFIKSQELNIEELSKSRKGTKKHQLYEINQWFIEQSKTNK